MPLPTGGPWPPPPHDVAQQAMTTWDAWYTGDVDKLAAVYGGNNPFQSRPSQHAGGLVGAMARFFWGRPITGQPNRSKLHLPVAADLCRTSAKLLFAEPPTFSVPDAAVTTTARIDKILNTPDMHSRLLEGAETGAALGGTYLQLVWDKDIADHVMLHPVAADAAYPEFRWGRLAAVTFCTNLPDPTGGNDRDKVWRHLERHEPGVILHGLYEGTVDKLGQTQPLEEHPATAVYAGLVDDQQGIPTGVKGLTAGYVPNARPNRAWRRTPGLMDLGRPDLAGIESIMDFIDETWSSLARDIRLAKAKIIVPEYMLTSLGVGKGAAFDTETEVYSPVKRPPTEDGKGEIVAQQFEIRLEEHLGAINAGFREALREVGYSPLTFGLPDEAAATATEVTAKEKESLQTRGMKIRHWSAILGPLGRTLLEVDAQVFGTGVRVSEDLELTWPDGAKDSLLVRAQSVQALKVAEAASTQRRVEIMQPDLDEEGRDDEVARILAEVGVQVPDPVGFNPGNPDQ